MIQKNVSSIRIQQEDMSLEKGAQQQFTAEVEGAGSVLWSIGGNESTETRISSEVKDCCLLPKMNLHPLFM